VFNNDQINHLDAFSCWYLIEQHHIWLNNSSFLPTLTDMLVPGCQENSFVPISLSRDPIRLSTSILPALTDFLVPGFEQNKKMVQIEEIVRRSC
jgi:hypothetical protein